MKRSFDIIVSFLGLTTLLPIFFIIGILIRLNEKGPILFKQKRVGKNGKLFIVYKFRSMTIIESSDSERFEPGNTSRITSIGKLLRDTKLDELPQLINVLKGDMSIVGPRPEVKKWVDVYSERWKYILTVRPGLTDNSSIKFRNEEILLSNSDDPEKTYKEIILPMKLDMYETYIAKNSLFGDIKIIFSTIFSVIYK